MDTQNLDSFTNLDHLNDKTWYDAEYAAQYINTLNIRTEKEAYNLIHTLKLERLHINQQIGTKTAETQTKNYYDTEFVDWRIRAIKAAKMKTLQMRWIKQYLIPKLAVKKEKSVWAMCNTMTDYILSLPSHIYVPSKVMEEIVKFKQLKIKE